MIAGGDFEMPTPTAVTDIHRALALAALHPFRPAMTPEEATEMVAQAIADAEMRGEARGKAKVRSAARKAALRLDAAARQSLREAAAALNREACNTAATHARAAAAHRGMAAWLHDVADAGPCTGKDQE